MSNISQRNAGVMPGRTCIHRYVEVYVRFNRKEALEKYFLGIRTTIMSESPKAGGSPWPENTAHIHYHAIHKESKKIFKETAVSKKDIRENKKRIHNACQACHQHDGEEDITLRQCAKCKGVWYCSKSALVPIPSLHKIPQLIDILRPEHKKHCQFSEGHGITKIVQNFTSNEVLNEYLQTLFVQTFPALLNNPRACLSTAFVARVDIGFEPVDIPDFFRLFNHEEEAPDPRKAPVRGMLQVNAFTAISPTMGVGILVDNNMQRTRRMVWKSAREGGAAYPSEPVAIVELGRGDLGQQITFALPITNEAIDIVRRAPKWTIKSALTGRVMETPFNIDSCMECIHQHTYQDKQDRFSLRMNMLDSDAQVIRDASDKNATGRAAQLLRARMARERIFKPVAMTAFERDGKLVPLSPAGRMVIDTT
ncbi:hypothetical protein C8F01DRAFT_1373522 [Mycena amicta]|nr:hypothetical protein C8F01DRAFT_1373522 [Mycena amicta]